MAAGTGSRKADGGRPARDGSARLTPAERDREIDRCNERLAEAVDELVARLQPREIARRGAADLGRRAAAAVRAPEGQLRVERVVGGVAALVALLAWGGLSVRRRLREGRSSSR